MKKLFLAIILLFSASLFAEEFTGIFGIKFGDSHEKVNEVMEQKGCHLESKYSTESFYMFPSSTTTYAWLKVSDFKFFFEDNKLYKIIIDLSSKNDNDDILDVCKVLIDKFEFKNLNASEGNIGYYKSGNITFWYELGILDIFTFTDAVIENKIAEREYNLKKSFIEHDL